MTFGIRIPTSEDGWSEIKIVPKFKAPVIVQKDERLLKRMQFGIIPSWSKEPHVKFSSFNARLDSLEKPVWKLPAINYRCLIPLTYFIEPIYIGEYAGNMVKFHQGTDLIAAAGICDKWVDKKTGEVLESFSMITDEPIPFVKKIGHQRSPAFLKPSVYDEWLNPKPLSIDEVRGIVTRGKEDLKLEVEIERAMAAGWEKRIPK